MRTQDFFIPNNVQTISASAFENCSTLVNVNFDVNNSKLTTINVDAFGWTSALKSIKFPKTLKQLDSGVFRWGGISSVDLTNFTTIDMVIEIPGYSEPYDPNNDTLNPFWHTNPSFYVYSEEMKNAFLSSPNWAVRFSADSFKIGTPPAPEVQ